MILWAGANREYCIRDLLHESLVFWLRMSAGLEDFFWGEEQLDIRPLETF